MIEFYNKKNTIFAFDEEKKRVLQTWEGFVTLKDFKESFEALIEFLEENEVETMISNTRRLGVVPMSYIEHAASITPKAMSLVSSRVAFVLPDNVFTKKSMSDYFEKVSNEERIKYFDNEAKAGAWLDAAMRNI